MTPETRSRLLKHLPRLAGVTDRHRLKVLSDIDRALAAEGLTWGAVAAELLQPPSYPEPDVIEADGVLLMVDRILRWPDDLSRGARDFLASMNGQALEARRLGDGNVRLSRRQTAWLYGLYEKAKAERERPVLKVVASEPSTAAVH